MAIATIFTRGYGSGSITGSIGLVVRRGYSVSSSVASADIRSPDYTLRGASTTRYELSGTQTERHPLDGASTARITLEGAE